MNNSIRWRLLLWYTVLSVVMAGLFGSLTYISVSESLRGGVDSILLAQAEELADSISVESDGSLDIELTSEQLERFQGEDDTTSYYSLWTGDGREIDSSNPGSSIPLPAAGVHRTRQGLREVCAQGPDGILILVGRSMAAERRQLRSLATTGLAIAVTILLTMLAGGWWLIGKALEPIARISRAANAISESNLTERIDASRMERELSELSLTINDAFDRLQSAFDRQTQFTADASHELRTPLSIVSAQADFALRRSRTDEEYRDSLMSIQRASARMRGVVEGLLTLARADVSDASFDMQPVDVAQVVADSLKLLQPLAEERGIKATISSEAAIVSGDWDRLSEAVANLLANGINYNRDEGTIAIEVRSEAGNAVVTVEDSGVGISETDLPHLFERFYQADVARSRQAGQGTGLGLAITKWIVEAHGGSISVVSREGAGATFTLEIPLATK